jgi:hypothetical protein
MRQSGCNDLVSRTPGDAIVRDRLVAVARQAFNVGEALSWRSYDPYDILLSPLLGVVFNRSPLLSRLLLQVGRRSGRHVRPWLGIPRHEEPKALADFLQAATILARSGEQWASEYLAPLSIRLLRHAAVTDAGRGWGNQFPWVSRFDGIATGEPNVYTTTAVCRALLDSYELDGRAESLESAIGGAQFILNGLGYLRHRGRKWLRYTAGSTSPIVNVQASSASFFARLSEYHDEAAILEAADCAAAVVLASQRKDGSWTYSDDGRGVFVDGFHTGFILVGLQEYAAMRKERAVSDVASAIEAGFAYFKEHLLTTEGLPRGFAGGRVSLDGQNLAQCIQTLLMCGGDGDAATASALWELGLARVSLKESTCPPLRWSVGPFLVSTTLLLRSGEASPEQPS